MLGQMPGAEPTDSHAHALPTLASETQLGAEDAPAAPEAKAGAHDDLKVTYMRDVMGRARGWADALRTSMMSLMCWARRRLHGYMAVCTMLPICMGLWACHAA